MKLKCPCAKPVSEAPLDVDSVRNMLGKWPATRYNKELALAVLERATPFCSSLEGIPMTTDSRFVKRKIRGTSVSFRMPRARGDTGTGFFEHFPTETCFSQQNKTFFFEFWTCALGCDHGQVVQ